MNILLIEPDYKNKYPPMGLMKISTYHKQRNDTVIFYKGKMPDSKLVEFNIDRVYITTLFTFYYRKTIDTIEYYTKRFKRSNIYIGGIMASLLTEKLRSDVGDCNIVTGQLTNARMLGFQDDTNIDELPLDYSILDEIKYDYPAGENYFSYLTRGCPNRCAFCAVPTLEPKYKVTKSIRDQINGARDRFGDRRNLLLLDNNIFNLSVQEMTDIVQDLKSLGFTKEPTFLPQTPYQQLIQKSNNVRINPKILHRAIDYLEKQEDRIRNADNKIKYHQFLKELNVTNGQEKSQFIIENSIFIESVLQPFLHKRPLKRYIDFNQGLEAARITYEKMSILSELPLYPVRIAFDHYNPRAVENYCSAIKIANQYGITQFSNYMLYNFNDSPDDLWHRLKINITLAKELKVSIFSFPMKYIPISETDRKHIGPQWNKKYLQALSAILLVTKGVVAQGEDFFNRAFGATINDYHRILMLPRDFIIYRGFYEAKELTQRWDSIYQTMNKTDRNELIAYLTEKDYKTNNSRVLEISTFYEKKYSYNEVIKRGC